MVAPISAEILARRTTRKEPRIDFLIGASSCRSDLKHALLDYRNSSQVRFGLRDFWGYRYDIPQETKNIVTRVFCGAKNIDEPVSEVMLRVSIHHTDSEGVSADELGSQEYILRYDKTIAVTEDDGEGHVIDGIKQEDLAILNKVQALAKEVKEKLDTCVSKEVPSTAY